MVWNTDAVYLLKYITSAGKNALVDRDDDLHKIPAIQVGAPRKVNAATGEVSYTGGRNYLTVINAANTAELLRIYDDTGVLEATSLKFSGKDAVVNKLIVSSEIANKNSYEDYELLSASAVKELIDSLILDNDALDSAARTAASDAVTAAFQAADVALSADLTTEINRATSVEADLLNKITANENSVATESARALAAEASLLTSIDAIPALIDTKISDNEQLDVLARQAISDSIDALDLALSSDVTDEVNRATAAEANLLSAINAETAARTNALAGIDLSGIATNATAIATEKSRAEAEEASLLASIQANTTAISNIEQGADIAQVGVNTTAIASNLAKIEDNEDEISANLNLISSNATNISNNTASIQTNATNIANNATSIQTNTDSIANEISAREASDLLLEADILTLDDKFDTLVSSSIPASYLLKVDGNDVVISTDGVSTGTDDPSPNNLTAIQELYAQINNLITQALPSASMFKAIGNDYVVTGFLTGHAGGSLLEFSTGDIILPTEPTGFPEASFRLSDDYTEIIFGE